MKRVFELGAGLTLLAFLAGCGADGEPITPTLGANVNIGPGGVSTSATVGVSNGPVSIGISL